MVFGILRDVAKTLGEITGTILGVPAAIIAETLSIPLAAVKAAKEAGCDTYEEIRDFHNDKW